MPFSLPSHPGPEDLSLWTIKEHCVAWQGPTQLHFIFPDAFEDAGEAGGQFPVSDVRQGQGLAGGGEGSCGYRYRGQVGRGPSRTASEGRVRLCHASSSPPPGSPSLTGLGLPWLLSSSLELWTRGSFCPGLCLSFLLASEVIFPRTPLSAFSFLLSTATPWRPL